MPNLERIYHHGVPMDNIDETTSLNRIGEMMATHPTLPNHIVTLTIGMYNAARQDNEYRSILDRAALVVPESTGLMLYSRIHPPTFGKIPGGNILVKKVIALCAEEGKRVVLFGTTPDNRRTAVDVLKNRYPGLEVTSIDGEYSFDNPTDSQYVASAIDTINPDFGVMAVNEVDGEKWLDRWVLKSGVQVNVIGGFGQTIDQIAGRRYEVPEYANKRGIGWLLRLPTMTPERRRRYLNVLSAFGKIAIADIVRNNSKF